MRCPKCNRFAKIDHRGHNIHIGFCSNCSLTLKAEYSGQLMEWGYIENKLVTTIPKSEFSYNHRENL